MVDNLDAILNTIQPIEMPPDPDREVEVTCECCPECGEDFDERLLIDDCFDAAADFLGQDWLNAQVETFRDSPSPNALRKHIVGESEHLSKSVFECFSPWFAEELAA